MLRIFDLYREIASELAHRLPNIVSPTKREIATYGLTSATTLDPSFILHAGIKASRAQLVRKEYEDAQQRVETLKRDFDSGELQRNIRGKIINRQLRDVGETTLPLEAVGNLLEENEENWYN